MSLEDEVSWEEVDECLRAHGLEASRLLIRKMREERVTLPKIDVWFVDASTGCSCCRDENFRSGPYRSLREANEAAEDYTRERRLVSQYSTTGIYYVNPKPGQGELLPDGRIIVGGEVYEGVEERK